MKRTNNNSPCILATDFREVEKNQELWLEEREKKGNIYQAILEYIRFLEAQLEEECSIHREYEIEQKLKQLRKELKKYETPSILASAKYDLTLGEENKEDGPIKKIGTIFRKKY